MSWPALKANQFDADILLSGILPTLQKSDLTMENITAAPSYHELNRWVTKQRGGPFSIFVSIVRKRGWRIVDRF